MTGETDHKLRGDYSRMRPDYTVDQDWDAYSSAEHELWRRLYARQGSLVPKYAISCSFPSSNILKSFCSRPGI